MADPIFVRGLFLNAPGAATASGRMADAIADETLSNTDAIIGPEGARRRERQVLAVFET
jgi:hypothetical protein